MMTMMMVMMVMMMVMINMSIRSRLPTCPPYTHQVKGVMSRDDGNLPTEMNIELIFGREI